jgi:transcription elongation factor Elf1
MSYKCPLCNYRTISLQGLKLHFSKKHVSNICPLCRKRYKNINWHFYVYAKVYNDSQHLLLYYLYPNHTLDKSEKQVVEKLLSEVVYG